MTAAIRPAAAADAAQVAALYNYYVANSAATLQEKPATVDDFCELIGDGAAVFLCAAEDGGKIAGYCYAAPFKSRCGFRRTVEVSIYVAADAVGGGVGKALMAALLKKLQENGTRKAIAVLSVPNPASAAFHEKFGFVHCGTLPGIAEKFGKIYDSGYWVKSLAD